MDQEVHATAGREALQFHVPRVGNAGGGMKKEVRQEQKKDQRAGKECGCAARLVAQRPGAILLNE